MTIVKPSWKKAPISSGKSYKKRGFKAPAVYSAMLGGGPRSFWGAQILYKSDRKVPRRQGIPLARAFDKPKTDRF